MKSKVKHEVLTGVAVAVATFLLVFFTWYGIDESRKAAKEATVAAIRAQKVQDDFQKRLYYIESFSNTFNKIMTYLSLLRINTLHLWDNAKHYKGKNLPSIMLNLNEKRGSNLAYLIAASNNFLRLYKKDKISPKLSQRLEKKLQCVIEWNETLYIKILKGEYNSYNFITPKCKQLISEYPKNHCYVSIKSRNDFLRWGNCINDSITNYEIKTGT